MVDCGAIANFMDSDFATQWSIPQQLVTPVGSDGCFNDTPLHADWGSCGGIGVLHGSDATLPVGAWVGMAAGP